MLKLNKQNVFLSLTAFGALTLSGCSWFSANDGREEIDESYLKSRQSVNLQIPSDVTELKQEDNYQIPEGAVIVNREAKGQGLGLEPPQLLLTSGDGVREDNDAKHPTVWLRGDANRMGEIIDGFVASNKLPVVSKNTKSLKTDWISDDNEGVGEGLGSYNIDGQRHKFELSMIADSANEFGVQALHSASEQEIDGQWRSIETSDRVAKQFLNQFIGFYDGIRNEEARAKILADGTIGTRLGTNAEGHIALVSDKAFQAVWQQTPAVLKNLNLSITDRDQSAGTFYFRSEEPAGLFGSIFSKDKSAKVDLKPGDYRLVIKELSSGTSISFTDEKGDRLAASLVGKIYPEFSAVYRSRETQR